MTELANGMAPRIANLAQWRDHLLHRLARDAALGGDPRLADLHRELTALPGGRDDAAAGGPPDGIAVPLLTRHGDTGLAFLSTATTFGRAVDVTAAELSIEAPLPADRATAERMRTLGGAR